MRFGEAGPQGDRRVVTGQRLIVAPQLPQDGPTIDVGVGLVRPQRDRQVEAGQSVAGSVQTTQRVPAVDVRLNAIRPQLDRPITLGQSGLGLSHEQQRMGQRAVRLGYAGLERDGRLDETGRLSRATGSKRDDPAQPERVEVGLPPSDV